MFNPHEGYEIGDFPGRYQGQRDVLEPFCALYRTLFRRIFLLHSAVRVQQKHTTAVQPPTGASRRGTSTTRRGAPCLVQQMKTALS